MKETSGAKSGRLFKKKKKSITAAATKSRTVNECKLWVAVKSLIDHIDLDMVPLTFNGRHLQ